MRTQTRCPNVWPDGAAILQYEMYRPGNSGAVKSTEISSSSPIGTQSLQIWQHKKSLTTSFTQRLKTNTQGKTQESS